MMVVVCIPEKRLQTILERELKNLAQKWKLTIFQCPLGSKPAAKKTAKQKTLYSKDTTFVVRVLGRDKAGIVAGISRILAQNHFNITDLQCKILGSGAKALYAMVLECSAPPKASFKSLAASLNRFARALDIEVRLQKADLVQL